MRKKVHIRRNDIVKVISGKDRGKTGKVLRVFPRKERAVVEGVNKILKHVRANPQQGIAGGILEREAPIHVSNLMVVCPSCNQPTRVGHTFLSDGRKVRVCKKCNANIDK